MPSGNRSILAATAGLIALLIAFGMGSYVTGLNNPEEQRRQPYRYAADKPAEVDPAATGEAVPEPFEYRTPCDNPKGHDESDLCAQWKAANAAEDSAFWAKWGIWIATIGSALLLWQIALTRKAVVDTGLATKAMNKANRIAQAAQRPWITTAIHLDDYSARRLNIGGADDVHVEFEWTVTFTNTGAMMAENFHSEVRLIPMGRDFLDEMPRIFEEFPRDPTERDCAVVPGESLQTFASYSDTISALKQKTGLSTRCYLLIFVMCRYRLPGRKRWRISHEAYSIGLKGGVIERRMFDFENARGIFKERIRVLPIGRRRAT